MISFTLENKQKYSSRIIDLMTAEIIIVSIFFRLLIGNFHFVNRLILFAFMTPVNVFKLH